AVQKFQPPPFPGGVTGVGAFYSWLIPVAALLEFLQHLVEGETAGLLPGQKLPAGALAASNAANKVNAHPVSDF
ncbi:MAG: hypothetical protein ACAI34_13680, partial [Verrucomicrobium sp.]